MNNNKLVIIFIVLLISSVLLSFLLLKQQKALSKNILVPDYNLQNITENPNTPENSYSAWIAWWNDGGEEDLAIESLKKHSNKIKIILPMWYRLNTEGKIVEIDEAIKKGQIEELALSGGVDILATITNDFDPKVVSTLLDNEELQKTEIENLVFIAISNGYTGWDLDWEEMFVGDAQGFNYFVENLSIALHEKGLILSVTVQAQTGTDIDAPSVKAQDWKTLAKFADQIRIMGYDFHHSSSAAGAITPLSSYKKMLDIAVRDIPKEKLVIGLPTYGYDWINTDGKTLQYKDAVALYQQLKINPSRDPESGELWFKYKLNKVDHEAWFEDYKSTKVKTEIARSLGLNNFTFWRLGGEDERIWDI